MPAVDEDWQEVDTTTSRIEPDVDDKGRGTLSCIVHVSESTGSTRTQILDRDEITVGRSAECTVSIPCSHISRVHVRISRLAEGWTAHDSSSVNGILINGVARDSASLAFGDRIDLGRGELLLFRSYDSDYQRAVESQRLESLGRLASGIAHDFNNALMAIIGAAGYLRDELEGDASESVSHALDDIMSASDEGAALARQLLGFARKTDDVAEMVDAVTLVKDVARLAERTLGQAPRVQISFGVEKTTVIASRSQLAQVLMNLCSNAHEAMPEGGEFSITIGKAVPREARQKDEFVCITVEDTGVGMTPEVRERVFEPFYSTKGEGRGKGLGLATSYGIVKNHGGIIEVQSEPGKGTSVSLFLPSNKHRIRTEGTAAPNSPTESIQDADGERCILLAEDQRLVRRHMSRSLKKLGFVVVEVVDGVEAVEAVRDAESPFSLAMLDLQMPRRSGDEACRMIRSLDPGLPVVMVSGNSQDPRIEELLASGNVDVLSKPFGSGELARALQRAR